MKPFTTQTEAIAALDTLIDEKASPEEKKLQYYRLRELIMLLIPKGEED